MSNCGWCSIHKANHIKWQKLALEYWSMYSPLPHKIKQLEHALESEKIMNAILTEELSKYE